LFILGNGGYSALGRNIINHLKIILGQIVFLSIQLDSNEKE
jgi:hypothetical protein